MRSRASSKGFSMIEVVIALFILAISLLALAGLMVTTTRNNAFGNHMTEAATFAQDKLEELRAAPWASIVTGGDTVVGATGISYARGWTVRESPAGDQRWVTVTINWTDPTAQSTRTINIRSVISE